MEFSASGGGQAPDMDGASSGSSGNAAEEGAPAGEPLPSSAPDTAMTSWPQPEARGDGTPQVLLVLGCVLGLALALMWMRRVDAHNS